MNITALARLADLTKRADSMSPHDVAVELRSVAAEFDKPTAPENPQLQALYDRCHVAMEDLQRSREERAKP